MASIIRNSWGFFGSLQKSLEMLDGFFHVLYSSILLKRNLLIFSWNSLSGARPTMMVMLRDSLRFCSLFRDIGTGSLNDIQYNYITVVTGN